MTCLAGVKYTVRERYREYLRDHLAYGFSGPRDFRSWYLVNHKCWA